MLTLIYLYKHKYQILFVIYTTNLNITLPLVVNNNRYFKNYLYFFFFYYL